MSSAERIANAVDRMVLGCVRLAHVDLHPEAKRIEQEQRERFRRQGMKTMGTVVDVTAIYEDFITNNESVYLYEDSMLCPPFGEATICYYSAGGKFTALIGASTYEKGDPMFDHFQWTDKQRLGADHPLDWEQVKWITATALYIFADETGEAVGPVMSWRFAIAEDGTPIDINWVNRTPHAANKWDNAVAVYVKAITWLNCRNIDVVTPKRDRSTARRLSRFKTEVKEIHIRPVGKTYQNDTRAVVGGGVPLTTVRGHLAKYGIDGRKKLFGRIVGVFWIPAHARGTAELGERNPTRIVETV